MLSAEGMTAALPLLSYCGSVEDLRRIPATTQRRSDFVISQLFPSNTVTTLPQWVLNLGDSVLHLFARLGIEGVVLLQLEDGTDVNATDGCGQIALIAAANSKSENLVRLLLERGADVTASDADGFTAMQKAFSPYYAVRQNNGYTVPILRLLMEIELRLSPRVPRDTDGGPLGPHPSSLISSRNKHWQNPMHIFVNLSPLADDDALRWMLDHGADLYAGNWRGQTPLHIAVSRPILSAAHISAMLETADIIAKTDDGETVLQLAEKPVKSAI